MPVSGVIVICEEGVRGSVQDRIDAHPRLEVRDAEGDNLIAVTDTATVAEDRADVEWIGKIPGVVSAYVAFTNMEDIAMEGARPGPATGSGGKKCPQGGTK